MKKEDSGELIDNAVAESIYLPLDDRPKDPAFERVKREIKDELLPHKVEAEKQPKTWRDFWP